MSHARTEAAPIGARPRFPTSARLARRAAGGQRDAFEEIFRLYHQDLYRYCLAIVRNPEDAQDAVQATMAAALRALPGEERDIALRPWLYRVAHNESISVLRGRTPAANPEGAEEATSLPPETELADRDRLRQLVADMLVLPDRQRSAIVMRELNDLSYAEIGLALSSSEAGAKQTVYEARQALHDFEQGRTMDCESAREAISAGDRRRLRGRRITSHLRSCDGCLAFEASIAQRRGDLQMLCPPLPALAAAGLLGGLLGGSSGSAAAGGGVATAGGVAGGTAAAGAGGAAGAGVAGSLALKGASLAAAAVVAAGAADIGGVIDLPGPFNGGGGSQTGGTDGGSNGGGLPVEDGDRDSAAGPSSGASAEGSSALSAGGRAGPGDTTATQRDGEDGAGADSLPTGLGDSAPAPGPTSVASQSGSSSGESESGPGHSGSGAAPSVPSVQAPSVPSVQAPSVQAPSVPSVQAPSVPSVQAPSVQAPSVPSVKAPSVPSVQAPSVQAPSVPSLPSLP